MLTPKDVIIALSDLYQGDWEKIFTHLKSRTHLPSGLKDEAYSRLKSKAVSLMDEEYPPFLGTSWHPPFLLYYYGNIDLLTRGHTLTVVGSRANSDYGKEVTERLLDETHSLISELTVVSGMASGIDGIAMRRAIKNGDRVIAVLGCGIDRIYPSENADIYEYCARSGRGLVLSEYPADVPPLKDHFPMRNRLLAVLGDALLIPEARQRSGTSVTARLAVENGTDVLAVPHEIYSDSLTNSLISDGAHCCRSGQDIADVLSLVDSSRRRANRPASENFAT